MRRFKSLAALGDWFHGRDEDIPPATDAIEPAGDAEGEDDPPPDECPSGGEHDVQEIRSAVQRAPLARYCVKCRQDFPVGEA